jgi:predicted transposase/invertase (TIGR01784 family)
VRYRELLTSERVRRIYVNELDNAAEQSLGIKTVKLVIEPEESAVTPARNLIDQARLEIADEVIKREFLQLIETILVYKLPNKSREEIEAMFGLSELKQTKVYQEAKQEGLEEGERKAKLEAAPRLLALGLSVEQVAEALGLDIEAVGQAEVSEVHNDDPIEEV